MQAFEFGDGGLRLVLNDDFGLAIECDGYTDGGPQAFSQRIPLNVDELSDLVERVGPQVISAAVAAEPS